MLDQNSHTILQNAVKKHEQCLKEAAEWQGFIDKYREMAGLPSLKENKSVVLNQIEEKPKLKSLVMSEWIDWAEKIVKKYGKVETTRKFMDIFESKGYSINQKTLSAYLSQSKDRFKYDKSNGGWRLVYNPQRQLVANSISRIWEEDDDL